MCFKSWHIQNWRYIWPSISIVLSWSFLKCAFQLKHCSDERFYWALKIKEEMLQFSWIDIEAVSFLTFSLGHSVLCSVNRKVQISLLHSMFGKIPIEVGHLWGLIFGCQLHFILDFSLETHMNIHKDIPSPESPRWPAPSGRQSRPGKTRPVGTHSVSNHDS